MCVVLETDRPPSEVWNAKTQNVCYRHLPTTFYIYIVLMIHSNDFLFVIWTAPYKCSFAFASLARNSIRPAIQLHKLCVCLLELCVGLSRFFFCSVFVDTFVRSFARKCLRGVNKQCAWIQSKTAGITPPCLSIVKLVVHVWIWVWPPQEHHLVRIVV